MLMHVFQTNRSDGVAMDANNIPDCCAKQDLEPIVHHCLK